MKIKNIFVSLLFAVIILPCALLLSACGEVTSLGGNSFRFKSYDTDGYADLTTSQMAVVTSHISEVTSKETLVEYIKTYLGEITFINDKVGTFTNDAYSYDYYLILIGNDELDYGYWGKTIQNSDSEEFVTIVNNEVINDGLTVFASELSANANFKITIKNPEFAGSELKMVAWVENTEEGNSFNTAITFFYEMIQPTNGDSGYHKM